jgi:hypothetical protein
MNWFCCVCVCVCVSEWVFVEDESWVFVMKDDTFKVRKWSFMDEMSYFKFHTAKEYTLIEKNSEM